MTDLARAIQFRPKTRELIEEHVTKILSAEVVEPAQSDWALPIFIVPKKESTHQLSAAF